MGRRRRIGGYGVPESRIARTRSTSGDFALRAHDEREKLMNQAWSAYDAKDPKSTIYRTYDEQGVSRETIDQALLVLDPVTYWSFDEQPIAELAVRQAIRAAALRHERLVRVRENC